MWKNCRIKNFQKHVDIISNTDIIRVSTRRKENPKMKKAIENYEAATKEMDAIDAEFENDLFNEELETKWNEAYKKQFAAFIELANMIVKVTNNQIDMQTAREMINTRFEDIKKLVAAFA